MEFNESDTEPSTSKDMLYQQVQEQSDICDVTVTAGNWSKKFHWCVLVESAFFDNIRRNSFLESQTGIVNINIDSPLTIEIAISFLYGKRPNITEDNVSNLMELSEFLMIPNLKAACVRFAKLIRITDDNYIRMMELSTLYEFEFPDCLEYVKAHLSDLLARNDALNLTKECLVNLLSDPLLTYVTAEERFTFLLKWIKHHPQRESDFIELFNLIDIDDMDAGFVETEVSSHPVISRFRPNLPSLCEKSSDHRRVLLFTGSKVNDRTICFDLERHRWFGIQTNLSNRPENYFYFSHGSYDSVHDTDTSCVYEVERKPNSYSYTVVRHNLANNEVLESAVRTETIDGRVLTSTLNAFVFANNSSQRNKLVSVTSGIAVRQLIFFTEISVGELNFPESLPRPIITIPDATVTCICANYNNVVAMVTIGFDKMYLYDIDNGTLDILEVSNNNLAFASDSMLSAHKNGFMFHDRQTVFSISRLSGPALCERYLAKKTHLASNSGLSFQEYYFCDRMWYRLEQKRLGEGIDLSCISHKELVSENKQSRKWNQLSYLQTSSDNVKLLKSIRLLMAILPKSKLKCHIDCPHCKVLTSEQNFARSDIDREFSNSEYYVDDDESDYEFEDDDSSLSS